MKRRLGLVLVSVTVLLIALIGGAVPMSAATTQDVTIDALPQFLSISNSPSTFDFLTVAAGVDEDTGTDYFTVTNTASVVTDIDIKAITGWEGGANDWTWGAAAEDTARLHASDGDGAYDVVITNVDTDYELMNSLAATTDDSWELELDAPSSFTYGNAQQIVVRLTQSVAD